METRKREEITLIAEDNPTNQRIVKRIIGEPSILANNGKEALRAILPGINLDDEVLKAVISEIEKKIDGPYKFLSVKEILADINATLHIDFKLPRSEYNRYKAILMDDQMPEMRGSIATILIRIYDMNLPESERNFIITCSDTFKNNEGKFIPFPGANTVTPKPYKKDDLLRSIVLATSPVSKAPSSGVEYADVTANLTQKKRRHEEELSEKNIAPSSNDLQAGKHPRFFSPPTSSEASNVEEKKEKQPSPPNEDTQKKQTPP